MAANPPGSQNCYFGVSGDDICAEIEVVLLPIDIFIFIFVFIFVFVFI
jgi:hypothetical protein